MAAGSANGREQTRQNRHQHGRTSCLVPDFQSALIENWAAMLMSTLRNFVQAMGGDLEVRAVFPDRVIVISNFSSLASKPSKARTNKKPQQMVET